MKKTTFLVVAMLAALFPIPSAIAAPEIKFLNPSGYQTQPFEISDAMDADGNVHLVAWARDIPSSALVEFELEATGQNPATFTAERVGTDTWEALFPIPDSFTDGPYTLRARLYAGVPGDADEVANHEVPVEINQSPVPPPSGESVEMSYPDNASALGVFVPKGKRPVAIFDYAASTGTEQVRAFYTLSDPGIAPVWEDTCGSSAPDDQGFGKVRCTLKEGHNPLDVTAVAVLSNRAAPAPPPAPPNPALDTSGDAHRVLPYLQQPRTVEVSGGAGNVTLAGCHTLTANVTDQSGRPIAVANVDVHAEGPEDELHFGTRTDGPAPGRTDPFQNPDAQHVSRENAKSCTNDSNVNFQGDHNSPGRDDLKHIESLDGTSNTGDFRFALQSDFAGGTLVQVWADVDDDDLPDLNEATGGAQIGWGGPQPEPTQEIFLSPSSANGTNGSCVELEIVARRGGGAFPSANVDIHIQGPDPAVEFCDVAGGGTRRPPESGGHTTATDQHEDGTRHAEGETDASGSFLFGVRSMVSGTTQVQVWLDRDDDDILNAEPTRSATVTWQPAGERSISIASNRSRVAKGRRVRLSGDIEGDTACSGGQPVEIQAKPVRGGRFGTVKTVTTQADGSYTTRIRMNRARKFRAVVQAADPCSFARSNTITVRVRS